ncbi:tail protein [Pseudomonas weihenstephanensis]|uniref:Tail protein n=1 Tax=Pseudomonas weihenstephanensis TaxID=1608994 RepID=A0A0J6ITU5_9PSED|nr:phage tail protein [Pseudomonas weihenstephanensis]KMN15718.1 tail protein [Pseudomonas weihenstephanensis]
MKKLQALTSYLIERRLVMPEQLDSWANQISLELIWKPDVKGLHFADMRYSAAIVLERFADEPGRLMALLGSWLESHDRDRDGLPALTFAIDMLDNDLADVEITVEFVEPQYLAEDPDGEIVAFGQTWSFIPFDLWVAEEGEVGSNGR